MIPDKFDAKRWVLLSGLKLTFSTVREILVINLSSGLLLGFMLRDTRPVIELVAWLGALIAICCVCYADAVRFIRLANERIDVERWQRRFRTGAAASGLPWGYAAAVLFPTESLAHQVVVALVLAALCAGAIIAYSAVRNAYFVFLLPAVLPLFVRFVVEGNDVHYSMAIATLFFVCVVGRSSLESTRLMSDVFSARAHTIKLARSLTAVSSDTRLARRPGQPRRVQATSGRSRQALRRPQGTLRVAVRRPGRVQIRERQRRTFGGRRTAPANRSDPEELHWAVRHRS